MEGIENGTSTEAKMGPEIYMINECLYATEMPGYDAKYYKYATKDSDLSSDFSERA